MSLMLRFTFEIFVEISSPILFIDVINADVTAFVNRAKSIPGKAGAYPGNAN